MQAQRLVFPAPQQAQLESFEISDAPLGETEVLVETLTTLVSAGTELAAFTGQQDMNGTARYPARPGYAATGRVIAAGEKTGFHPGQLIYHSSQHATHARFDTRQRVALPLPEDIPLEYAPFARISMVSMTTMRRTLARAGDRVAIIGLGVVGNMAAQNFRSAGMQVVAYDIEPGRRRIAEACGIETYDPIKTAEEHADRYQLVVEVSGRPEGVATAVKIAQVEGEIFMIGAPWTSATSVPATALTQPIFLKYLILRSGWEWALPQNPTPHQHGSLIQNGELALRWIRDEHLKIKPLLSHVLPPSDAQSAYEGLQQHKDRYIGVVFDWRKI